MRSTVGVLYGSILNESIITIIISSFSPRNKRSGIIHGKVLTKRMFHDILLTEYIVLLLYNKGGPTNGETEEL